MSCNKDESQDLSFDSSIVGEWTVSYVSINGSMTGGDDDDNIDWDWIFEDYPVPLNAYVEPQNHNVNFSNSPNQISSSGSLNASFNAHVAHDEYFEAIVNIDLFKDGNWSINNTIFTVTHNNQNENYTIKNWSENEFTILKQFNEKVIVNYELLSENEWTASGSVLIKLQKN